MLTELFISGYPPEDLVLKPAFLGACLQAVEALAADTADGGPGVIVGFPRQGEKGRHNSVAILDGGRILFTGYVDIIDDCDGWNLDLDPIQRGGQSRTKLVEIDGLSGDEAKSRLTDL